MNRFQKAYEPRKSFFQRRIGMFVFAMPLVFFLVGALFGENGVVKLWRLKREIQRVEQDNVQLEADNKRLEREIKLLKTNRTFIEALARKELGYAKKGEKVYWFVQEATTPPD